MLIFIVACYLLSFRWLLCLLMKVKSQNGRGSDNYNPESGGFAVDEYVWSPSYLGGIGSHPLVMWFGDMSRVLRLWQPGLRTLVWLSAQTIQFWLSQWAWTLHMTRLLFLSTWPQIRTQTIKLRSPWMGDSFWMLISIPSVNKTYVQCVRKHKQNAKRTLTHPVDIHICTLNYPAKIVGAPKSSTRWYQRPHPQAWLAIWKHLSNLWVAEFFCGGIHSPSM